MMDDSETESGSGAEQVSPAEPQTAIAPETLTEPAARRPLKTRQWPFFQWLAATLAKSDVTPNSISVASIFASVAAGCCLAATAHVPDGIPRRLFWFASALCIQLRLIANLLDGMVAVEGGKASAVGDLYNEVPDRLSDPAILVGAGFAVGGCPILGLTASLVAVFVAYVRAIGASVGVGQVFLGPFAKPQRMALMTGTCLACAFLPSQFQPIHNHTGIGLVGVSLAVIIVGGVVTSIRRLRVIAARMRRRAKQ
jgi:phosphatidylglycerophosphate synthase